MYTIQDIARLTLENTFINTKGLLKFICLERRSTGWFTKYFPRGRRSNVCCDYSHNRYPYNPSNTDAYTAHVEEVGVLTLPAKSSIGLTNPHPGEPAHFIQIWIKSDEPVLQQSTELSLFHLQEAQNGLLPITNKEETTAEKLPFSLRIGLFGGRKEATYRLKSKRCRLFAFVIAGAFEIEGRLLHEKDGLALWDTEEVELEALSNHTLVLVMELRT